MAMTETEACKKWCPMTRVGAGMRSAVNRVQDDVGSVVILPVGSLCIASDCMMWRWSSRTDQIMQTRSLEPQDNPDGACGLV